MCSRDAIKDFGYLALETMEKIVAQIEPDYVWEVDLGGRGEPTTHPEFHELLRIMARPGVTTDVTTTAVTFTDKNIEACVNHVDVIRLSVSSIHKPIFDKVHIGLKHDKIWRNIAALAEAAADKVIVHLVGGPVIYDHLHETAAHLRTLGFTRLRLFPLWNRGGDVESELDNRRRKQLMNELGIPAAEDEYATGTGKLKMFVNALIGKLQNSQYCPVGDASVSINYKGEILGCFQDFGLTSNVGDIRHDHLRDIIRQRVKRLGRMKVCEGCNANKAAFRLPLFTGRSKSHPLEGDEGKRRLPIMQ